MSVSRIKLFETVLNIHEKGAASLTASERSIVEAETRDLLNSAGKKYAQMAPPGFDNLLRELKMSENPDDAFGMVLKFLEGSGELGGKPSLPPVSPDLGAPDLGMGLKPDSGPGMGLGLDKGPTGPSGLELDKGPMGPPGLDKGPAGLDDLPGVDDDPLADLKPIKTDSPEPPKEAPAEKKEDSPMDKPEDNKEDKKEFPFDNKKDKKEDKPEEKKEEKSDKEALLDRAAKLKKAEDSEGEDECCKSKKEFPFNKKEDKEDDKEDKKEAHMTPALAERVHVRILKSRDILASFDGKPMFIASPKDNVKQNLDAIKRMANKVFGWIVYEGPKVAARKCGSKLMAGVDEDIQPVFDSSLIPPVKDPVSSEGDDAIKDSLETPSSEVIEGAEFVTKETPEKVTAGVDDAAQFVTDPSPDAKTDSVLKDNDTVHTEPLDGATGDVQEGADVDFQSVEANLKKLYTAKAHKLAKSANEQFVKKFVKCIKIASQRMLLNHDDNPYKAASMDILANEQEFANGDSFIGLGDQDASELIEMIASHGQQEFVDQLLERTANLMKKSDEYLGDIEGDLSDLNIKSVEVQEKTSRTASKETESLKQAATEGNFIVNTNMGRPVTSSQNNNSVGGIQMAMGNTLLNKRARALRELKA